MEERRRAILAYLVTHTRATVEELNELATVAEEDEMSEEELISQLIPDSILVNAQGGFEFWYGDGGVFWNRSLCVSGSLSAGVTNARIEG